MNTAGYYRVSVDGRLVGRKYGPGQNQLARLAALWHGGRVVLVLP